MPDWVPGWMAIGQAAICVIFGAGFVAVIVREHRARSRDAAGTEAQGAEEWPDA